MVAADGRGGSVKRLEADGGLSRPRRWHRRDQSLELVVGQRSYATVAFNYSITKFKNN